LAGADAAYVAYAPDLAVPGAPERVEALAALAARRGLRRLVLLSGRGEDGARRAEDAVLAAFPGATVVRCAWFMQNFSEDFLLDAVRAGTLALPVGDVPEPFVDVRDVADVAVAALLEDGHAGRVHELTGPEPLTFAQVATTLSRATGRDVAFVPLPVAEFTGALRAGGVPDDAVALLEYLFTEVLDGRNSAATDDVARVLGRPARRFADYAREVAAGGVWNPA
ncbi:NmrA family transcriptional regulator, partial [Kineococcus glutinatus]|uniref:NmrA family NAD(P)-binding protein n=1 Tax=Kineococcus glutinatus TaxID=1070872 RepID=UPI0031E51D60